jgi:non-ribosomal peptide synthetase component F
MHDAAAMDLGAQLNLAWAFHQQACAHPERPALCIGGVPISYGVLADSAARIAGWLHSSGIRADGSLDACVLDPAQELRARVVFAPLVVLDDPRQDQLWAFTCRESPAALLAFAAAADLFAFPTDAGVDDPTRVVAAVRAAH